MKWIGINIKASSIQTAYHYGNVRTLSLTEINCWARWASQRTKWGRTQTRKRRTSAPLRNIVKTRRGNVLKCIVVNVYLLETMESSTSKTKHLNDPTRQDSSFVCLHRKWQCDPPRIPKECCLNGGIKHWNKTIRPTESARKEVGIKREGPKESSRNWRRRRRNRKNTQKQ